MSDKHNNMSSGDKDLNENRYWDKSKRAKKIAHREGWKILLNNLDA